MFSKKFAKTLSITMGLLVLTAAFAGCAKSAPTASAGGEKAAIKYPTKPIEIICPYSAGGGQDVWARLTAKYMVKYMPEGTKVIVNNISAGGGIAGATAIASAKPDGYQIGAIVPFQLTDQFINKGTPYTENSFYPLAFGSSDGNFLIANPKLGFKDANDFINYAKANPDKLTFGVGGAYNSHDFFRLKIELATGMKVKRMQFNGGAPTLTAVAGGNCDVASVSISEALAAMASGQVVALAVSDPQRTPLAQDVKTMKELGIDVEHAQWRCMTVPPETPQEIKKILSDAFAKTFADPQWIEESKKAGLNPINIAGEEAVKFYNEDFKVYKELVNKLGLEAK